MKATGIVRRMDDLGRVVIPKEIRRTMRIREGDPLEIYTDREGEVIFKKYSPIVELQNFATEYAEALQKTTGLPIFVCDRDGVIAVCGASKREYLDRKLTKDLDVIIENRVLYTHADKEKPVGIVEDGSHFVSCAMPILAGGDIIGCVLSASVSGSDSKNKIGIDAENKLIQTAGLFLGKQMEA